MRYLLDTDTCIYIIKRRPESILLKLRSKRLEQVAISTISVAELEFGVAKSRQPDQNRVALMEFLIPFALMDFDQGAARDYGRIRAALESSGSPIGPMDLLLAAQAVSRGLTLVTNNEREFRRVEGLRVENWSRHRRWPTTRRSAGRIDSTDQEGSAARRGDASPRALRDAHSWG